MISASAAALFHHYQTTGPDARDGAWLKKGQPSPTTPVFYTASGMVVPAHDGHEDGFSAAMTQGAVASGVLVVRGVERAPVRPLAPFSGAATDGGSH